MVKRAGGFRAKTRFALQKSARKRGKISTTRLMQEFKTGDKVVITQEPAIHKGMPHPRYKARTGIVIGKQGRTYKIRIFDGGKEKILLSAPVHLTKMK
ncbi:MAG: 50S ribosomal protein L21e [Candidatus Nanoarchaeia archaeon]